MNWLPIKTAPKDGTDVLLYFPKKHYKVAFWSEESEDWFETESDDYSLTEFGDYPTHWAVLHPPMELVRVEIGRPK